MMTEASDGRQVMWGCSHSNCCENIPTSRIMRISSQQSAPRWGEPEETRSPEANRLIPNGIRTVMGSYSSQPLPLPAAAAETSAANEPSRLTSPGIAGRVCPSLRSSHRDRRTAQANLRHELPAGRQTTALGFTVLVRGRPTSCNDVCVTQVVHIPYVAEQNEDGTWRASAVLRPGVGAVGDGATREEAVTDLRAALLKLLKVVGPPSELTVTVNSA
jgi:hypothetical protein